MHRTATRTIDTEKAGTSILQSTVHDASILLIAFIPDIKRMLATFAMSELTEAHGAMSTLLTSLGY